MEFLIPLGVFLIWIQAHAEVVNLFLKNGRTEMRQNHQPPEKE